MLKETQLTRSKKKNLSIENFYLGLHIISYSQTKSDQDNNNFFIIIPLHTSVDSYIFEAQL